MVTIRPAAKRDFTALGYLYVEFHEFHVRGVPDRLVSLGDRQTHYFSELFASFNNVLQNGDVMLSVAEINSVPVGFVEVYLREDKSNPSASPIITVWCKVLWSMAHLGDGASGSV